MGSMFSKGENIKNFLRTDEQRNIFFKEKVLQADQESVTFLLTI